MSKKKYYINALFTISLVFLLFFLLFNIKNLSEIIRSAMHLSAFSVIPTLFPFILISDILVNKCDISIISNTMGKAFSKLFGLSKNGGTLLLLGMLCGFPMGAKLASDFLRRRLISENEAHYLSIVANTASPAFVIGSVGNGMMSNINIGIILYFIEVFSVFLFLIIKKKRFYEQKNTKTFDKKCKSFADSIKDSALSSLFLTAFIVTFSFLAKLPSLFTENPYITAFLSSVFEVSTGCFFASKITENIYFPLFLAMFSISFSGISVFLQSKIFIDIKPSDFIVKKSFISIISLFSLLTVFILSNIF